MLRDYGSARQARRDSSSGRGGWFGWGRRRRKEAASANSGSATGGSAFYRFFQTMGAVVRGLVQVVILTIIVGLLGVWIFFSLGRYLFPLEQESTIVFIPPSDRAQPWVVAHFSPQTQHAYLIEIDASMSVMPFQASQPLPLGQSLGYLEQHPENQALSPSERPEFIRAGISFALQRSVDYVVSNQEMGGRGSFAASPKSKLLSFLSTWLKDRKVNQTISWRQKLQWFFFVQTLPDNHLTVTTVDTPEKLAQLYKLDDLLTQYKNCSVAVVNGTTINGVAGQVSQVIENTGFRVIRVDDTREEYTKTTLFVPQETHVCNESAALLQALMPKGAEVKRSTEVTTYFRADVVLIVESDTADLLFRH